MKYFKRMVFSGVAVAFGVWWGAAAPPEEIKVGDPEIFKSVPAAIVSVTSPNDYIANSSQMVAKSLPPYDEVILNKEETIAYVPAKDGRIWRVDLTLNTAKPFVDVPLMAAGARLAPDNSRIIYFCASYLYGAKYPATERVGLYQLDIETKAVKPLVLDVPLSPQSGGKPKVYTGKDAPKLKNVDASRDNSRPLKFCNDLDVSSDGKRIYFTEPFSYGKPQMGGGGTYREAVSLGRNGRVWLYDVDQGETRLVAQNFTFPDGILVEGAGENREDSILVTETVKFRIIRMFVSGPKAGKYDAVWENLPGMPDGMDRDNNGRIWIGILKQRSSTINWIHKNPWLKPFFLRLPSGMMPVSRKTSILALSADASRALFYSEHDGSVLSDISVVVPGRSKLYLAAFGPKSSGFYHMPFPKKLAPRQAAPE